MLNFLKHFLGTKAKDAQAGFTRLLVEFDPETASEAEIGQLDQALTTLTRQMVEAKTAWDRECREAQEIKKNYDLRLAAAERLQLQAEAAADASQKALVETSLGRLVADLEKMAPEVDREACEAVEAQKYYEELTEAVKSASERLKTARSRLADAQRQMQQAKVRAERAREQEERAKVVAGISRDAGSLGTAFEAMSQRARELEAQAQVHTEKARLLSTHQEEDPLVRQALEEAKGATALPAGSIKDRLTALKK